MVELTKINGTVLVINSSQIECIEVIPETKVIMMNGRYHIVSESAQEIIDKTIEYNRMCNNTRSQVVIPLRDGEERRDTEGEE